MTLHFALRYVLIYAGVNSLAELVINKHNGIFSVDVCDVYLACKEIVKICEMKGNYSSINSVTWLFTNSRNIIVLNSRRAK